MWGCRKKDYYINEENLSFHTGGESGKCVLQVQVVDSGLEIQWKDPEWQGWHELINAPEFKDLIDKANQRLTKSSKGDGKGKKGNASDRH